MRWRNIVVQGWPSAGSSMCRFCERGVSFVSPAPCRPADVPACAVLATPLAFRSAAHVTLPAGAAPTHDRRARLHRQPARSFRLPTPDNGRPGNRRRRRRQPTATRPGRRDGPLGPCAAAQPGARAARRLRRQRAPRGLPRPARAVPAARLDRPRDHLRDAARLDHIRAAPAGRCRSARCSGSPQQHRSRPRCCSTTTTASSVRRDRRATLRPARRTGTTAR